MMYTTKQIAKLVHLHPNTVRVYEQWGYISPVERLSNGYRKYEDYHLKQLQIIRLAFRQELLHNDFRKRAIAVIRASGQQQYKLALQEATAYIEHLRIEHQYVMRTIQIAHNWSKHLFHEGTLTYTHQEVAKQLGVTEEVLRNWERNGLFLVERNSRRHRIYKESDLEKLHMIRTLRSANFSYSAILNFLLGMEWRIEEGPHKLLHFTDSTKEMMIATDRLEASITSAIEDIKQVIHILMQFIK